MKKVAAIGCAVVLVAVGLFVVRWARRGSPPGVASSSSTEALGVPPAVAHSDRLGELPADEQMTVRVLLRSPDERGGAEDFLRAHRLTVTTIPDLDFLIVSGPVRDVKAAFGVDLYEWHNRKTGEDFYANEKPPTLPFDVAAVFGLDDSARAQPFHTRQLFGTSGLSALQLRIAYNAQSLLDSGTDGSGQTVAIYAQGGFSKDDVDHFADDNNLDHPTVYVTDLSGALTWLSPTEIQLPTETNGTFSPSHDIAEEETEMDIEAVHSIAPKAAIHVYELATSTDLGSGFDIFLVAVALFGEHIASISAGFCESDLGDRLRGYAELYKRIVETYDVSVFAASGDSGKICPSVVSDSKTETNYPASDPSVTAVGGTHLDLQSDDTMNSEQAWDPGVNWTGTNTPEASGGGTSSFARPSWQIGPGVPPGTQRLVPDVAADADKESGLTVYAYNPSTDNDESYAGSGTSLAAPLWAGFAALYNQFAQRNGAPLLGLANPMLYRLAGQADDPLFDVTTVQNGGSDLFGSELLARLDINSLLGWDGGTGLGSFNAYALVAGGTLLVPPPPTVPGPPGGSPLPAPHPPPPPAPPPSGAGSSASTTVSGTQLLKNVVCPASSACVAVGAGPTASAEEGVTVSITDGAPGPSQPVPGTVWLNDIACQNPQTCLAVGAGNNFLGFAELVPIVNGIVGSPQALPDYDLYGISCPAPTFCVAVGDYYNHEGTEYGAIVPVTGGTMGTPIPVPAAIELYSVACSSAQSCVAVGQGIDSGIVVPITNGAPETAHPLPATAFLGAVACPGADSCVAVGENSSGNAVVTAIAGGIPAAAQILPAIKGLRDVACPTPSTCEAVGVTRDSPSQGVLVPIVAGIVGAPDPVTGVELLAGIACPTAVSCVAVGATSASGPGAVISIEMPP